VFDTVNVCAALVVPVVCDANVRLAADSETTGAGAVPVPESDTVCGVPAAFEAIDTLAVLVPAAVGVNVTEIVQLAPAATVVLAQPVDA